MSHPLALSLKTPLGDLPLTQMQPYTKKLLQLLGQQVHLKQMPMYPLQVPSGFGLDKIPPPALLGTVNYDAIDLNDEVFFNYNAAPSYTTSAADAFVPLKDMDGSLLSLLTVNAEFEYTALHQLDLAASPLKYENNFDSHYSHKRRFLLAAEQLSRMSLKPPSRLPSPDLYGAVAEPSIDLEERTINPRQLLGDLNGVGLGGSGGSIAMAPPNSGDDASALRCVLGQSNQNFTQALTLASTNPPRYILPSLVLSPSLSTFFSKNNSISEYSELVAQPEIGQASVMASLSSVDADLARLRHNSVSLQPSLTTSALNNPLNPYVMNDECVSAITYWLNNTADVILEKPPAHILRGPTGVLKPGWSRRNSILVPTRVEDGLLKASRTRSSTEQKRRRRKSLNTSSIPESSLPSNISLNLTQAQTQTQALALALAQIPFQQTLQIMHPKSEDSKSFTGPSPHMMLPLSMKTEELSRDGFDVMKLDFPATKTHQPFSSSMMEAKQEPVTDATEYIMKPQVANQVAISNKVGEHAEDEPKPFPCPDCEKQFKRLEHLKRHIRSVHSNIRPFHCKYCEKKFLRSDNLAQHLKTHFKVNANGTTSVIYGNPNPPSRSGRKKSTSEIEVDETVF